MQRGFTLIELMIVIAIIAIIAAIAIPNLMESRVSSNEAAAGASLKSGIVPAQAQFQSSLYADDPTGISPFGLASHGGSAPPQGIGGDRIPDFAATFNQLAGGDTRTGASTPGNPALHLLPTSWTDSTSLGGNAYHNQIGVGASTVQGPNNNSYIFALVAQNQNGFCCTCAPGQTSGAVGRRKFAISAAGIIYGIQPTIDPSALALDRATIPFGASAPFQTAAAGWSPVRM